MTCTYALLDGSALNNSRNNATQTITGILQTIGRTSLYPDARSDISDAMNLIRIGTGSVPIEFAQYMQDADSQCRQSGGQYIPNHGSGRIIYYTNGRVDLQRALIHEGIHALHFHRYPELRRIMTQVDNFDQVYQEVQRIRNANPRSANAASARRQQIIQLLKALSWTEYWAYRRVEEFRWMQNAGENNPQQAGRTEAVGRCLLLLRQLGVQFDPSISSNWRTALRQNP